MNLFLEYFRRLQTLQHLSCIEDRLNKVESVFGFQENFPSLTDIRMRYKRLCSLVYSDMFVHDVSAVTRDMTSLSIAMYIVKSQCQYRKFDQIGRFELHCVEETEAE